MNNYATYSRSSDCFPANAPEVFDYCEGCYTFANGKKYIDWGMGLRSVILGHAYPAVNDAVHKAIDKGVNFTRCNPYEEELRELMKSLIPCAEQVKFGKNGSDVTSTAVKLARAYTGKHYVLVAQENPFISQHDWFIQTTKTDGGVLYSRYTGVYSYDDMAINGTPIDDVLTNNTDVAAIVLDPATVDITREKLQYIRDLCDKYGIIMILDEVISGFRYDLHGVQGLYGVMPDLATFAKAMGNGYSISALCGKQDIMKLGDREYGNVFLLSGTYFSETTGLAAAIATIKEMQEKNVNEYIKLSGYEFCFELKELIEKHDMQNHIKFTLASRPYNLQLSFSSMELKTLFDQCMVENGILMPYIAPSFSHTNEDIDKTIEVAEYALNTCRKALDAGNVNELLINGHSEKPVFRRHKG